MGFELVWQERLQYITCVCGQRNECFLCPRLSIFGKKRLGTVCSSASNQCDDRLTTLVRTGLHVKSVSTKVLSKPTRAAASVDRADRVLLLIAVVVQACTRVVLRTRHRWRAVPGRCGPGEQADSKSTSQTGPSYW